MSWPSSRRIPGDAVLIPAGTVHSLANVVVFEIQQNSDVTFRSMTGITSIRRPCGDDLCRWRRRWPALISGKLPSCPSSRGPWRGGRSCVRSSSIANSLRSPASAGRGPFTVGKAATPRVLAASPARAQLEYDGQSYAFGRGQVLLLPAVVGECLAGHMVPLACLRSRCRSSLAS